MWSALSPPLFPMLFPLVSGCWSVGKESTIFSYNYWWRIGRLQHGVCNYSSIMWTIKFHIGGGKVSSPICCLWLHLHYLLDCQLPQGLSTCMLVLSEGQHLVLEGSQDNFPVRPPLGAVWLKLILFLPYSQSLSLLWAPTLSPLAAGFSCPAGKPCFMDTGPMWLYGACAQKGPMCGVPCSEDAILKFLILLSLNLCFRSEVRWQNGAYARRLEPWALHGLTSGCLLTSLG